MKKTNLNDWIVLFGPPGVGKSTLGRELSKKGYYYYEADDDLLPEVIELNSSGMGLTEEIRERQYTFTFQKIIALTKKHNKLVVANDFMWERYRTKLKLLVPELRWIYLTVDTSLLIQRVDRPGHVLSKEFAMEIVSKFETPIPTVRSIDTSGTIEEVIEKILQV